jgi:predicted nuclease of predicted toxin-antitoxin system
MIRLVVDAQLPPALVRFLASLGYEAKHLVDVRDRFTPH